MAQNGLRHLRHHFPPRRGGKVVAQTMAAFGVAQGGAVTMAAVTGFADVPPVELKLAGKGQTYEMLGLKDHTRRDGTPSQLAIWRSECMTCGEPFEFNTPATRFPESRRCSKHAQPGRKVWLQTTERTA